MNANTGNAKKVRITWRIKAAVIHVLVSASESVEDVVGRGSTVVSQVSNELKKFLVIGGMHFDFVFEESGTDTVRRASEDNLISRGTRTASKKRSISP